MGLFQFWETNVITAKFWTKWSGRLGKVVGPPYKWPTQKIKPNPNGFWSELEAVKFTLLFDLIRD